MDVQIVNCQDAHSTSPLSSLYVYSCPFLYPLPPFICLRLIFSMAPSWPVYQCLRKINKQRKRVSFSITECLSVCKDLRRITLDPNTSNENEKSGGEKNREREGGHLQGGMERVHLTLQNLLLHRLTYNNHTPFGGMHGVVRTTMSFLYHLSPYTISILPWTFIFIGCVFACMFV